MGVVIYQSLIIFIFVLFYGIVARQVQINGNITKNIGSNNMELACNFTTDPGDFLNSVWILATNITLHDFEKVASFTTIFGSKLQPFGIVLFGNASLSLVNTNPKRASMSFDDLNCKHSRLYKCELFVITEDAPKGITTESEEMGISVKVPPSKPDGIVLVHTPVDSPVTTTKLMNYRTSSPSTAEISIENETVSVSTMAKQNTTTTFSHSTIQTTGHNTATSTPPHDDISPNISYKTTTDSTQLTNNSQGIVEGDNITVVCTGDVGKPPAEHFFKKYRSGHIVPLKDTVITTSISEMSDNCSYYRSSNITFQVTAHDNNVVIQCVVNSSMAEPDMFVKTEPIEVYYEVSMPTITKSPEKTYYVVDQDTSINLTCKSDGNPKPYYQWYKENYNERISPGENLTITDVNITNSGVYTCTVSNTFNGYTYKNDTHVRISIMNKDDIPTTQSSSTGSSSDVDKKEEKSNGNKGFFIGIGVTLVVIVVIIFIIACTCKRKCKSDDSKLKPVTELRTGDYDYIALEDDAPTTKRSNNGLEVEDINKHNAEYLKKQEEEGKKKYESNTPPQPAVYAQVNEVSKLKYKQKTETPENPDKQEEDPYAETQEDVYDKAGDRRHKENKNAEQFDSSTDSSNTPPQPAVNTQVNEATRSKNKPKTYSTGNEDKQEEDTYEESQEGIYDKAGDRRHKENENVEHFDSSTNSSNEISNGDNQLSIQTNQIGFYGNQEIQKDENRKVATVTPMKRSSSESHNDEQTNLNRNSQSKKGYENIIGTHQTSTKEEDVLHRTAL